MDETKRPTAALAPTTRTAVQLDIANETDRTSQSEEEQEAGRRHRWICPGCLLCI